MKCPKCKSRMDVNMRDGVRICTKGCGLTQHKGSDHGWFSKEEIESQKNFEICGNCLHWGFSEEEGTHCCDLSGTPCKKEDKCGLGHFTPSGLEDIEDQKEIDRQCAEFEKDMDKKMAEEIKRKVDPCESCDEYDIGDKCERKHDCATARETGKCEGYKHNIP